MQSLSICQGFTTLRNKCKVNNELVNNFFKSFVKEQIITATNIHRQELYHAINRINGKLPINTEKQGANVEQIINLAIAWSANKSKSLNELVKITKTINNA